MSALGLKYIYCNSITIKMAHITDIQSGFEMIYLQNKTKQKLV